MHIYLLTFLSAFIVTYLLTPVVRKIAPKIKAVDIPNNRKVHLVPIPRLGGVAIFIGFCVALYLAYLYGYRVNPGIIIAGFVLVSVGIIDDIKGIRPTTKLIWQIICAFIIIYFGLEINFISNPFNGVIYLGFFAIPLTLFWIVGMTNAINLIDGLDGLATGVCVIAAFTLFVVAMRMGQISTAIIMLALAGTSLAFLRYNFPPASIFLGDSGAMFLGFVLAAASITGVLKTTLVVALLIPIVILGVPIFDTLFAIGRRLKNKKHPFEADDKHIHHMLLRAGFNTREAVFAIYIVCFILSFIALFMAVQR